MIRALSLIKEICIIIRIIIHIIIHIIMAQHLIPPNAADLQFFIIWWNLSGVQIHQMLTNASNMMEPLEVQAAIRTTEWFHQDNASIIPGFLPGIFQWNINNWFLSPYRLKGKGRG